MATTHQGKHSPINSFSIIFLLLIAALPFLLSVSFHTGILYLSKNMTWQFGEDASSPEKAPATIVLDGQRDDGLKFQGTDRLDSFYTEDQMVYPAPEIEYRSITPEVDFYPDARVSEELDIISIEAAAMDNQWVNPSTGRQPLYTGPEKFVGSFSRHIQVLREGGLDVVFIFDATASMQSFLMQVKQKIEKLAAAFKKLVPTCRIGLVAYRDVDEESEFVTRVHPLTYGASSLHDFLEEIDPKGGADRAEAVYQGLVDAVEKMAWQETSKKFILIIGDAPPHPEEMSSALELVETFHRDMGGTVSVLDTRLPEYQQTSLPSGSQKLSSDLYSYSADDEDVMDEFRMLAQAGLGESARLENEEIVVKEMLLLIFGERWEMYLSEFMKNL
jgi:Mg-chelatase subunit ChlD